MNQEIRMGGRNECLIECTRVQLIMQLLIQLHLIAQTAEYLDDSSALNKLNTPCTYTAHCTE